MLDDVVHSMSAARLKNFCSVWQKTGLTGLTQIQPIRASEWSHGTTTYLTTSGTEGETTVVVILDFVLSYYRLLSRKFISMFAFETY